MSTPIALAKKYCVNWQDGLCSGIDFHKDGSPFRFRSEGAQCLLKANQRCSYFETAVLPMGDSEEWQKKYPGDAKAFAEGADRYFRRHSGIAGLAPKARRCPDCGTPIGPRKRYCALCADRRSKESDRNYQSKKALEPR